MNEYRRKILDLLAAGKITAEEAERLIAALDKEQTGGGSSSKENSEARSKARAKYLRIMVEAEDRAGEAKSNVNVRVPMDLLRAGVRLASVIPAQAREHVNDALRSEGIPFDLGQVKPENLEALLENLNDLSVDAGKGDKRAKVRVFCE